MRVDLQDGFNDDEVEIHVNGKQVMRQEGVTTRRVLGFALSFEIDVDDGPVDIEIRVPTRNLSQTTSVEPRDTANVGVSIRNEEIKIITSSKRFGYA
jgi:hypothetical protein